MPHDVSLGSAFLTEIEVNSYTVKLNLLNIFPSHPFLDALSLPSKCH